MRLGAVAKAMHEMRCTGHPSAREAWQRRTRAISLCTIVPCPLFNTPFASATAPPLTVGSALAVHLVRVLAVEGHLHLALERVIHPVGHLACSRYGEGRGRD